MAEPSRVEELRRRVHQDPASLAFAALAEEYRKLGKFDAAVATCRSGLQRHPTYISARVTLARALAELGEHDAAADEFHHVLKAAPQNLSARKGLADHFRRRGNFAAALAELRLASALAPQDPDLPESIWALEQGLAHSQQRAPVLTPAVLEPTPASTARELAALESLLGAIERAKALRAGSASTPQ